MGNNVMDSNIIDIVKDKEHGLLNDQNIWDSKQFMYPAYVVARKALYGIIKESDNWHDRQQKDCEKETLGLYGYANNIIAFSAGRGQGKTSAMLSFSRAIAQYTTPYKYEKPTEADAFFLGSNKKWSIKDYRFYVMPPIDPTMLNSGDDVIQLVLGKVFQEIQEKWKHPARCNLSAYYDTAVQDSDQLRILEEYQKCCSWLRLTSMKKKGCCKNYGSDDELEQLLEFSDIFEIKKSIREIIHYFFKLRGSRWKPEKSFLVIQLDDQDMQFEFAYEILEGVRKYLALPNVVVMMATYLDQLRGLVEQNYTEALNGRNVDDVHRMAAKYLDKLIPASRTVYLPSMKLQRDMVSELKIRTPEHRNRFGDASTFLPVLEEEIFKMIWKKTGLVFIKHEGFLHHLLPTTLRGLQHLYRLLDDMDDPQHPSWDNNSGSDTEFIEARKKSLCEQYNNIRIFEDYFINDWCSSKLKPDDWNLIRTFDETPSSMRIKYAIKTLKEHRLLAASGNKTIVKLSNKTQTSSGVKLGCHRVRLVEIDRAPKDQEKLPVDFSYTAFLEVIYNAEANCVSEWDFRFVFAMRAYFTILFNKVAISDELKWLDQNESPISPDFKQLYKHITGKNWAPEEMVNVTSDEIGALPLENIVLEVPLKRKSLVDKAICSFMHFPSNGSFKKIRNPENQKDITDIYKSLVYICCNWDVQDQIVKHAIFKGKDATPTDEKKVFDFEETVNTIKEGKGQYLFSETLFNLALQHLRNKLSNPNNDPDGVALTNTEDTAEQIKSIDA